MTTDTQEDGKTVVEITIACPMDCDWETTIEWSNNIDGRPGHPGEQPPTTEKIMEGPLSCPRCDERGVAHSNRFEVKSVAEKA